MSACMPYGIEAKVAVANETSIVATSRMKVSGKSTSSTNRPMGPRASTSHCWIALHQPECPFKEMPRNTAPLRRK